MFEYLKAIANGKDGINEFATGLFNALPIENNSDYIIEKSIETQSNNIFKKNQSAIINYNIYDDDNDKEMGISIEINPIEYTVLKKNYDRETIEMIDELYKFSIKPDNNLPIDLINKIATLKYHVNYLKTDCQIELELEDTAYNEYKENLEMEE